MKSEISFFRISFLLQLPWKNVKIRLILLQRMDDERYISLRQNLAH